MNEIESSNTNVAKSTATSVAAPVPLTAEKEILSPETDKLTMESDTDQLLRELKKEYEKSPVNLYFDLFINSIHLVIFPIPLQSIVLKSLTSLRTICNSFMLSNNVAKYFLSSLSF